jgi:hypothetical protein
MIFTLLYVGDRASLENTVQQVSLPLESVLVDEKKFFPNFF